MSGFDLSTWSTFQIVLFLDRMLDLSPLPHGTARPPRVDVGDELSLMTVASPVCLPVCPPQM